jgi:uncharacterized protein (DUF2384 family)
MYREEKIAATGPLARVIDLVESLWEDQDAIEQFFMTPNPGLGGAIPIELARSEEGAVRVENLVRRLAGHVPG